MGKTKSACFVRNDNLSGMAAGREGGEMNSPLHSVERGKGRVKNPTLTKTVRMGHPRQGRAARPRRSRRKDGEMNSPLRKFEMVELFSPSTILSLTA
jgi:hypothetical protein